MRKSPCEIFFTNTKKVTTFHIEDDWGANKPHCKSEWRRDSHLIFISLYFPDGVMKNEGESIKPS